MRRPEYRPLLNCADAARLLAEHWEIEVPASSVAISGGAFGTVARVECGRAPGVLKAVADGSAEKLALRAEAALALRNAGIPAPVALPSREGEAVVRQGGLCLRFLEWLPGTPYETGNVAQLEAAARTLARVHGCDAGVGLLADERRDAAWESQRVEEALCVLESAAAGGSSLGQQWSPWLTDVASRAREAVKQMSTVPDALARSALCHGDFRAQNVAFEGDDLSALYDLDAMHVGSPLVDLAYALVFFPAIISERPLCSEERRRFRSAYEEERVLRPDERCLLPALMAAAFARGVALWLQLCRHPGGEDAVADWLTVYRDFPASLAPG